MIDFAAHYKPGYATTRSLADGVSRRKVKIDFIGPSLQEKFHAAKNKRAELNYRAAEPSNFRSQKTGLGGTGDTHYQYGAHYWIMREWARDFDRNNALISQIIERGLDQVLGNGLQVDPDTGDDEQNEIALELWNQWAENPNLCDYTGRFTFDQMERLALRHRWVDGDCFGLLDPKTGTVRLEEGDRVTSSLPTNGVLIDGRERDVVHGVEIDVETGRITAYHFLKRIDRTRRGPYFPPVGSPELVRIASDFVLHIYEATRVSQHRGITSFHAVFDRVSLLEDIEFAELVKLQVASCISAFIQSEHDFFQFGSRSTEIGADGSTELTFDEFTPGMVVRLKAGEKVQTFSPTVTNSEVRELCRQIIREIGLAIGLPLELTLLDHSNSSFSANRATLESYKRTARRQQRWIARAFRSKVYEWKVRQWVAAGLLKPLPTITNHNIHYPEWSFLDPEKEAKADALRLDKRLASPRQVWAERGRDIDDGHREIAEDNAALIKLAYEQAKALEKEGVEGVTWRDVLDPTSRSSNPGTGEPPSKDAA